MIVYTATHHVTGLVYVGATKQTLSRRKAQHKSIALTGTHTFARALRAYGRNGFEWRVVQECGSEAEMHAAEVEWIAKLGTHGLLNEAIGGAGQTGRHVGATERAALSAARRAYYLTHGSPMVGRKQSAGHVANRTRHQIGKPSHARKLPVGIEADLLRRAQAGEKHEAMAREFGVDRATVSQAVRRARQEDAKCRAYSK